MKGEMRRLLAGGVFLGFIFVIGSTLAHEAKVGDLSIVEPWARATIGLAKNGVAYLTIVNHGPSADRLIAVHTPVAKRAGLHTHVMESGLMTMRAIEAIDVAGHSATELKPSGLHIMLMGVHAALEEGDSFPITLTFESAGDVELQATIMSATAMRGGDAHAEHERAEPSSHNMAAASDASCHLPVQITEVAEQQPGGALHTDTAMQQHSHQGTSMPEMEGAHMVHQAQHGGAFFMAPNKLHHLEVLYSNDCGFRVVFYNALTQHIRANRFQAFIRVIPEDEDEPETLRFLSPSDDGVILETTFGGPLSKPFDVELYVKFPGSEEPQLFNTRVAGES